MITNRTIRNIAVAALFIIASSATAFGQQKLDKMLQSLTENPNVEVIFSESRNPTTHEIVNSSYTVKSKDMKLYDQVLKIFQEERPNSTNYSQTRSTISIAFTKKEGSQNKSFVLIKRGNSSWLLNTSSGGQTYLVD